MATSPGYDGSSSLTLTPTQRHGQLTGFPRRIKDAAADVHNFVQKWEKSKNEGFNIVSDIANLKISERGADEKLCYPPGLEKLCSDLRAVYEKMASIFIKMKLTVQQLQKISELYSDSSQILFLSWPADRFYLVVKGIHDMYEQELEAKRLITESVAHVDLLHDGDLREPESSRDVLMTYVACWLHEPYVDEEARTMLLEELLLETGHKK